MILVSFLVYTLLISFGVSPDPEGAGAPLPDERIRDPSWIDLNLPTNAYPCTPG